MSNPFEKFKNQLKQKNSVDEFIEPGPKPAADFEDPLEDAVIKEDQVKEMNLEPKDQSFRYVFFPKNDISTYDLARILAITQLMITPDVYEKFPDDLKKHFTTFTDLKN